MHKFTKGECSDLWAIKQTQSSHFGHDKNQGPGQTWLNYTLPSQAHPQCHKRKRKQHQTKSIKGRDINKTQGE